MQMTLEERWKRELIANLDEWADHFRHQRHSAVLTILRAKTTLVDQSERIQALEDALNQIYHYTDCTSGQMAIIEKVSPELGGRADHTESGTGQ